MKKEKSRFLSERKYILLSIVLLIFVSNNFNVIQAEQMQDSMNYDQQKMIEEMMKEMTPEERKQVEEVMQIGKEMQEEGMFDNISTGEVKLSIPQKKDKILSEIPTLSSQQQYSDYLSGLLSKCMANIDPAIISEVDGLIFKNSGNTGDLVNLGAILLMQKKPVAAIYAAIKIAKSNPEVVLLQNNMAVILHQTGNPQISVPILRHLLVENDYPLILNNLAQSYLSLGDTANARMYFMGCLQKDPDHAEANCGMGLILSEQGKTSEATPYIKKSLKNGYSETADEIMKKHKLDIKFSDIKTKVPEYFNPQNYKPIPPVDKMDGVEPTLIARNEFEEFSRQWNQKKEKVNSELTDKMESQTLSQNLKGAMGQYSNSSFSKKAQLMLNLLGIEYAEFIAKDLKNQYLANDKEYYAELEKQSYKTGYGNDDCKKQIDYLNTYLQKSAKNHEAYQRETLPKLYEFTNQSLYWWYFLSNEEQYKMQYTNFAASLISAISEYDKMQHLYPLPEFISKSCKDLKDSLKVKILNDSTAQPDCPVKIVIPLGIAKAKWDCKGFELEGGEIIMLGYEREYRSGEMTFFIGLGAEFYGSGTFIGGVEAGGKIGSFVKVGKDFTIIDWGNKGEIGGEIGIGPFVNETKLTGVMGMQSGVTIDKTIMGETETIYTTEKPEVQINPEIHIFKP
jgi:tetratricopeptide (TPR) repeat protein